MSGEFQVTDIKRAKYAELFETDEDAADRWFKAKVAFITLDEKKRSGKEKQPKHADTSFGSARCRKTP